MFRIIIMIIATAVVTYLVAGRFSKDPVVGVDIQKDDVPTKGDRVIRWLATGKKNGVRFVLDYVPSERKLFIFHVKTVGWDEDYRVIEEIVRYQVIHHVVSISRGSEDDKQDHILFVDAVEGARQFIVVAREFRTNGFPVGHGIV